MIKKKNNKIIIFDGHGTLSFPRKSTLNIYYKVINKLTNKASKKQIKDQYSILKQKHYQFLYSKAKKHIKVSWEQDRKKWFKLEKELLKNLGIKTSFSEISYKILNDFMNPRNQSIYKDVKPILKYLVKKGYQIGLLTNSDERYKDILEFYKLDKYFKYLFISSEIGLKKPNLDLFFYITKKLKAKPSNIIYIGDNYKLDILPAIESGWFDSIFLNRKKLKAPVNIKSINSLDSVKKLL